MQEIQKENICHDLISIVLPTYNRGYIINQAINSVLNQTYSNWELFVVDDASTDDTMTLVEKYNDSRIKYLRLEKNSGANYCRNYGIAKSNGQYIAFLDSDNYWEKNKLEIQVTALGKSEKDVAFVFCAETIDNGIDILNFPDWKYMEEEIGEVLCKKNIVDTSTAMIKRECLEKIGGFDEQMPRLQDWEFFFRIINVFSYNAIYLPICLNHGILQQNSISKDKKKYVDAILYFMNKHSNFFNNSELIERHIRGTFEVAFGEEEYICRKIADDYRCYLSILYKALSKLMFQFRKKSMFYSLLYQWKLKSSTSSVFLPLYKNKDIRIAIYGLGKWGELFYQEIVKSPIKILYGIDQKVKEFHSLPIKKLTDELEDVDVVVVTVFLEYEQIKQELQNKLEGEIISIETFIQGNL